MMRWFSGIRGVIRNADVFGKKTFTVLYSAAIVCFIVISVAQVGLRNTSTRRFFTDIDSYEGAYFEVSADMSSVGDNIVVLNVTGDGFDGAEIIVNGESYAALTSGDNEISLREPSVIEVYVPDGTATVRISHIDDTLMLFTEQEEITVTDGIGFLGRVGLR